MNERILELAKTAKEYSERVPYYRGIQNGKTWEGKINQVYNSKFAELIVQECANIDFRARIGLSNEVDCEVSRLIREHFGVK